ncbi:MAG: spore maturation protein [Clostridia bacterium]|nr:spore maturation protein [Clostridia bacterium]
MLAAIPLAGLLRRVDVYAAFVEGAREGVGLALRIIPYVVSIFVAIGVFRESGALDLLAAFLNPLLRWLSIPSEVLPLMLIRPLSGNGALAVMTELLHRWGPDSYVGRLAAAMQASTDTTFYVISLYFGSVGVVRTRHAVAAGLAADFTGFLAAVFFVRLFYGY